MKDLRKYGTASIFIAGISILFGTLMLNIITNLFENQLNSLNVEMTTIFLSYSILLVNFAVIFIIFYKLSSGLIDHDKIKIRQKLKRFLILDFIGTIIFSNLGSLCYLLIQYPSLFINYGFFDIFVKYFLFYDAILMLELCNFELIWILMIVLFEILLIWSIYYILGVKNNED